MDVVNGLPRGLIGVDHGPVTLLQDLFLLRHYLPHVEQMPEELGVLSGDQSQALNMPTRDDQYVHGRLRMEVPEGQGVVIFVDNITGDLPLGDLTK